MMYSIHSLPRHIKLILFIVFSALLPSCATSGKTTLYEQLGGARGVERIVDNFIVEISYDKKIFHFFEQTNTDRFREKVIEHICHLADGPCEYTGDTMIDVHTNMGITEDDFNHTVDLLINAMDQAGIPHPVQNKLISRMAPLRAEIIYR